MKQILKLSILFLILTSCNSNESDITDLQVSEIEFKKMPKIVQSAIKDHYKPTKSLNEKGDTLTMYGGKDELICLDNEISNCEHKIIWNKIISAWLDHEEVILDDKVIIIEQSTNNFNGPYVVLNGYLYCRRNLNANDFKDPSKDQFCVVKINENE